MEKRDIQKKYSAKKKAISPVISTIILSAGLLIVLLVASVVATAFLDTQIVNTEFEQAKTNMILLNDVIQDVSLRQGSGGYVQFNQKSGGVGITTSQQEYEIIAYPEETAILLGPMAAGLYNDWSIFSGPGGDTAWEVTNDTLQDSYIHSGTLDDRESVLLSDLPEIYSGMEISRVTFSFLAYATGPGMEVKMMFGTNIQNPTIGISHNIKNGKWTTFQDTYENSGQLSFDFINQLEIGSIISASKSGSRVYITKFSVAVFLEAEGKNVYYANESALELAYRGDTHVSAAEMDLIGYDQVTVDRYGTLGYLEVIYDDGPKMYLDYNRFRVFSSGQLDSQTNLVEITLLKLTRGVFGGSGIVNMRVQNSAINTMTTTIDSGTVTIEVSRTSGTGDTYYDPLVFRSDAVKTVVIFSVIKLEVSIT